MYTEVAKGIYTFEIVLPENPLKWLNCYVIKGVEGGRNLLIDCGFRRKECREALAQGIKELELDPKMTDVFFTHLHSDHTGNADLLVDMGCKIMMGETDYKICHMDFKLEDWIARANVMGMSREIMETVSKMNPAMIYSPLPFEAKMVHGGDLLHYGGRTLECLDTPGHTPGNMCLYDRENKLMFTGDHVLYDITPNIVAWEGFPDNLGTYLKSLRMVRELPVETALPAHRTTGGKTFVQRIDELLAHHEARLAESYEVLKRNPGGSAYDIAGEMTWQIRAKNWQEFPPGQKWFAVGECMAHLERLEAEGKARFEEDETGRRFYWAI